MKKLLTYIAAVAFIFSLGACSEEEGSLYDFTLDPSVEATFAAEKLNFGAITEDFGGKVSVPMYRGNTAEAASVPVTITGGEGVFTPSKSSFDFAAGENVTYIDFTFDYETITPMTTIAIAANNMEDVAENGYGETEVTLQKMLTYNSIGAGYYFSGFIDYYYTSPTGGSAGLWEQEILKAEEGNYFTIPSPYVDGVDFSFYFDGESVEWYSGELTSTGFSLAPLGASGVLNLAILGVEVTSTSPYTIELTVAYTPNGENAYQPYPGVERITFPEGFTF